MDKEALKSLIKGLFDFAEQATHRPLMKLALGVAESIILGLLDSYLETPLARAMMRDPRIP